MNIFEAWWNVTQDDAIRQLQGEQLKAGGKDAAMIARLQEENRELKIRLGVLIRLLIERGVVNAEEYAGLVESVTSLLAPGKQSR